MIHDAEIRRIAYHEASHACVALVLGREYGAVIYDTPETAGGCAGPGDLSTQPPRRTPDDAEKYAKSSGGLRDLLDDAIITAAGLAGEHVNQGAFMVQSLGAKTDTLQIDAYAKQFMGDAWTTRAGNAFSLMVHEMATAILRKRWPGVVAVAEKLIDKKTLTAVEVAEQFAEGMRKL